jgi:hypothetical protein
LHWDASERKVLDMIAAHVDRRVDLTADYDAAEQVRTRIAVATELRLLETSLNRLLKSISTELPPPPKSRSKPMSITSIKAQRAANSRWNRATQ